MCRMTVHPALEQYINYSKIKGSILSNVNEPAREAFLYHIWQNKDFAFKELSTIDGRKIEIRDKGKRNYDAGPDFHNAIILIDGQLKRGDIEVHPVAGDWFSHGHHKDPRYNRVILHVVTMNCPSSFKTISQDGSIIPTINLDMFLEKTSEELEKDEIIIDADTESICGLSKKDNIIIRKVLDKAGDTRFYIKVQQFQEKRNNDLWEQIFYQSLFEALGYSKNQIPFRNLAKNLPVETLWDYLWKDPKPIALKKCEAYLLGAAGLLPSQSFEKKQILDHETVEYIEMLERYWYDFPLKTKSVIQKSEEWQFFRLRPQNFPTRRIAAAAILVLRFMDDGFLQTFIKIINSCDKVPIIIRELEKKLKVKSKGFWAEHYCFEEAKFESTKSQYIVGSDRVRDIVVNVVLPLIYAYTKEANDLRLGNEILQLFIQYPTLADNEILRLLRKRLFGLETLAMDNVKGVRQQQGMIHLFKTLCQSGSCERCLSVNAFDN